MIALDTERAPKKIDAFTVRRVEHALVIKTFAACFQPDEIIHNGAAFFGLYDGDKLIAFNSIHPHDHNRVVQAHRLAVLPDYRRSGLGLAFDEWMGELLHANGYIYETEVADILLRAFERSPKWKEQTPRRMRIFRYVA